MAYLHQNLLCHQIPPVGVHTQFAATRKATSGYGFDTLGQKKISKKPTAKDLKKTNQATWGALRRGVELPGTLYMY